ncbi:hypothetical protein HY68_17475 [Streptomyces sp. AcH 505]|uniref:hypothetical protein n=1 Tax=Streptomyces sp. AcH 505 TaxID=352211 RepID=UPI000591B47F|nr:hypothetical protein HY68_17475 [Streptomyces sp. AcH 505]
MSRQVRGGLTVATLVLVPLLAIASGDAFRAALDFTSGVLSLLSLTSAVAWGLIATDRFLLSSRHRLLAQGVHRATAVASLGFLLLHITVKVYLGHVALIGAVVPFGLGVTGTGGLIGLGSLAAILMVVTAMTGAMRSAFALPGRFAGRWRTMHMLAYPAWCFALMHGLYTGRAPATYVVVLYCLSLLGVGAAVSLRLLPKPVQRRIAQRLLALAGTRGPAEPEPARRDPAEMPLPGATITGSPEYERQFQRPSAPSAQSLGASTPQSMGASSAQSLGASSAQPLGTPLGRGFTPPQLAAPAQPVYEYGYESVRSEPLPPLPPLPDPLTDPFPAPLAGSGAGTGTGLAAGYAASRGGGSPSTGEIPLAERIPMTEELPVISGVSDITSLSDGHSGRQGPWPAPHPAPPGQSFAPSPPSPYSPYSPYPGPSDPSGSSPYGPGAPSPYDTGSIPPYDPGISAGYDTGSLPPYNGQAPASPVGPMPEAPEPSPGPMYPPPAGEPWNAPAGDRP